MRPDPGMAGRVIRLSTEQATRASVFWLGRVRARRPRPMMVLYRNTAVSPSERPPGAGETEALQSGQARQRRKVFQIFSEKPELLNPRSPQKRWSFSPQN